MKFARIFVSIAIVSLALIAFRALVMQPYHCNQLLKLAKARTNAAVAAQRPLNAVLAGQNIDLLLNCADWCESSVDALMVIAANERLLGRYDRALHHYDRAMTIDVRPELLLNRALTQYEAGDRLHALDSLARAVQFNFQTLWSIPDPALRSEVRERVMNEHRAIPW